MTEWRYYLRCDTCKAATPWYPGYTRSTDSDPPGSGLLCQSCGSATFEAPRPARPILTWAGVWYKPWTWVDVTVTWEWNEVAAIPWSRLEKKP